MATVFQHGPVALDLPDDWADQSTLMFVAPPPAAHVPTQASVEQPTESVRIEFTHNPFDSAETYIATQLEELGRADPSFAEAISSGPFECPLGTGWHVVCQVDVDDILLRQIIVGVELGPNVLLFAVGTASQDRFGSQEAALRTILESIRPHPGDAT